MDDNTRKKITEAIEAHKDNVAKIQAGGADILGAAAEAVTKSLKAGGRVYICGNGGSAADAQHIASELLGRFKRERKALAAIALTTDSSVITSISNDYGFDNAFTRQVEALVGQGDILWAISTSGDSSNVVSAAKLAKKKGAYVLAFTGKAASRLEQTADICLCADEESTARSQEIHQLGYHIICELVEEAFSE